MDENSRFRSKTTMFLEVEDQSRELTLLTHRANQTVPREPNEKKTDGQPNVWINIGENARPVTDPRYIPL